MQVRERAVLLMGESVSRAILNTVLIEIDRNRASPAAFDADPAAFVARFRLSDEERKALEDWDFGALYALGAHPFILWQAVRSVSVARGEDLGALIEEYRAAVEPHGYPDFVT